MHWKSFEHGGEVYDLTHLHPRTIRFERPEKGDRSAVVFVVDVTFSLHCFSRSIPKSGEYDRNLEYSDARETRIFDLDRYRLSKRLPSIIETLASRKCKHTGRGNFFTVEMIDETGAAVEYDIFFVASKPAQRGRVTLYVQSAYVRGRNSLPGGKPISFLVILHNTLNRIPLRD